MDIPSNNHDHILKPCEYRGRVTSNRVFCKHADMPKRVSVALCSKCPLASNQATKLKRSTCEHLLPVIEQVECQVCGGKKKLFNVQGCALHGQCCKSKYEFEKVKENRKLANVTTKLKCCATCKDHTSPMPHTINDITLAILCFKRPEKVVDQIRSIRQFYNVPIIVGDNGNDPPDVREFTGVTVHDLEYDCGISAARNRLTELVSTDLIMQLDDDFVWTESTKLEHLVDVLNADRDLTGVAGWMHDVHDDTRQPLKIGWSNQLSKQGTHLDVRPMPGPVRVTKTGVPWWYSETILNCALYRTEKIRQLGWLPELKVNEHLEFSWRAKQEGHKLAFCPWVSVVHSRFPRSVEYNEHRHRPSETKERDAIGYRTKQVREWSKTVHQPQRNILLLTPGHTGSTIVSRMLSVLGWDIGNADDYAEDVDVRGINQRFNLTGEFDIKAARTIVKSLNGPWCLKDPRFSDTNVITQWMPVFEKHEPFLIYLQRDSEKILDSYQRRRESTEMARRRIQQCEWIADHWPWGSVAVDFDQLREAVSLFDESAIVRDSNSFINHTS